MEPKSTGVVAALSSMLRSHGYGELVQPTPIPGVESVRNPDVALQMCYRTGEGDGRDEPAPRVVPDLVAYVITPTDLAGDIGRALIGWLDAGVQHFWELYPNTRTVYTWRADHTGHWFRRCDTLTAPDLLPGFAVPVADLFAIPGQSPPVQ